MYTIEEATRQRDLSKSIQLDAQEMMRRADYALGKAIRDGQANGTVNKHGSNQFNGNKFKSVDVDPVNIHAAEKLTIPIHELLGTGKQITQTYQIVDNASPAEFESILTQARERQSSQS